MNPVTEPVKITSLELENVKRIRACAITPTQNGLTVIGGRNNQGKTSVLDAIAWALGGDRHRPSRAAREGSSIPPRLCVKLSNGLVVERTGKNSDLKVTDTEGRRAGQQLLNEFVEQLALDLPKFMQASAKEKAGILLEVIGVEDQLTELDRKENSLYNDRLAIGRIADQKAKHAKEITGYPEAPMEPVSAYDLIQRQQDILAAAAIAAGIAAIMLSINSATKRANQASQDLQKVAASGGRSSAYGDIPGLASGGVVPPNDPFLAVLGDNKRETEIVAPYSAIKQAAGDAFDERGGASRAGGTAIAYLYLDGVKVGRAVYPYIQGETTRLGTKLVGGRR